MLLVTAVVWAVSVIRSVRVRAFVYSLPLPMTLALVTTGHRVDGAQLLGVVGLNLFFVAVAVTHRRWRWPILLADLAGVAAYVALSAGVLAVPLPFEATLAGTAALWAVAMGLLRRRAAAAPAPAGPASGEPSERPPAAGRDGLAAPAKLLVIFVGAVLTGLLGELLRGMVVTFPYSGVLVAVEARRQLADFTRHFARNSLALVGFLAAYHYLQDVSPAVALAVAWGAFGLVAAALHLPRRRPARPAAAATSPDDPRPGPRAADAGADRPVGPGTPGREPGPLAGRERRATT
ncbi:hypothetical protein EFE23_15620 [Micromonospora solifontis]|uniref:Uncharacterized protein n=1 Tax=Micromonospora solifontis TaxID=2487138 RepID=A0ABX9WED3_9ACTN|nr:hypothetical protein EFE23_15620 [Micromonospora solifontis]